MPVKVEFASFDSGRLRHGTSDPFFINKRKAINGKSSMGTPDNGEHTATEDPEISVFFDTYCSINDI